jgi:hypothetical protein
MREAGVVVRMSSRRNAAGARRGGKAGQKNRRDANLPAYTAAGRTTADDLADPQKAKAAVDAERAAGGRKRANRSECISLGSCAAAVFVVVVVFGF